MTVFVLIESGQQSPIAVLKNPRLALKLLPKDFVQKMFNWDKTKFSYREVVGEWWSETSGCHTRLVAYTLLESIGGE